MMMERACIQCLLDQLIKMKIFHLNIITNLFLNRLFKSPILLKIFKRKNNLNNDEINQRIEKLYGKSNFKLQKEFNLDLKSKDYPFLDT